MPAKLRKFLGEIAENVYEKITDPPEGFANISQWTKKEACWTKVKEMDLDLLIYGDLLVDKQEVKYQKAEEQKDKLVETGIQMQAFVIGKDLEVWKKIHQHYEKYGVGSGISIMQMDILSKMSSGRLRLPTEKQSKILYKLYEQAVAEGVSDLTL